MGRLLNVRDVAEILHFHTNSIRRWADMGYLPSIRVGPRGDRRFRQEDVAVLLAQFSKGKVTNSPFSIPIRLSIKQQKLLDLVRKNKTPRQISEILDINTGTVYHRLLVLRRKCGVYSTPDLRLVENA